VSDLGQIVPLCKGWSRVQLSKPAASESFSRSRPVLSTIYHNAGDAGRTQVPVAVTNADLVCVPVIPRLGQGGATAPQASVGAVGLSIGSTFWNSVSFAEIYK